MEQRQTAVWFETLCFVRLYACDLTGLLVESVSQKEEDNTEGNEGRPPGQQEHDDHATHSAQQRQPLTVEPEGRTPPWTHGYTYLYSVQKCMSTHSL